MKKNVSGLGLISGFIIGVLLNQIVFGLVGGVLLECILQGLRKRKSKS